MNPTEGSPIDEQRTLRRAESQTILDQPTAGTSYVAPSDEADDSDPNREAPMHSGPSGDPYADFEDDDDDWYTGKRKIYDLYSISWYDCPKELIFVIRSMPPTHFSHRASVSGSLRGIHEIIRNPLTVWD